MLFLILTGIFVVIARSLGYEGATPNPEISNSFFPLLVPLGVGVVSFFAGSQVDDAIEMVVDKGTDKILGLGESTISQPISDPSKQGQVIPEGRRTTPGGILGTFNETVENTTGLIKITIVGGVLLFAFSNRKVIGSIFK